MEIAWRAWTWAARWVSTSRTAWTSAATLALSSPTSKASRTYNVCGQMAAGQDVAVDSNYTDAVTATINF